MLAMNKKNYYHYLYFWAHDSVFKEKKSRYLILHMSIWVEAMGNAEYVNDIYVPYGKPLGIVEMIMKKLLFFILIFFFHFI